MADELQKHVEGSIMGFLGKYKGQIEAVLPKHMTPTRVMKLIVGEINRSASRPGGGAKLTECTPMSLINAVITASTMGLEIRPGSAYLVPFRDRNRRDNKAVCTLLVDYRGKIDLAVRSGRVIDITAEVVYSKEKFKLWRDESGLQRMEHEPLHFTRSDSGEMIPLSDEKQRGVPVGAYAVAAMKDGAPKIVFMSALDIGKIRKRSKASEDGPWQTDPMEMWKKTVIHRICKTVPQSPELALAQQLDENEEGEAVPLGDIIDVQLDEEDDKPVLEESREAQEAVKNRRLAELQAGAMKPFTQADIDAELARKKATPEQSASTMSPEALDSGARAEEQRPLTDAENKALDAEIMQAESKPTKGSGTLSFRRPSR